MAKELHNFDGNEVIATDLPQYLNQNFTAIPSNMGVWEKNEAVEVGDIRLLSGRENTGYVLECVASGTTGETQPVIIEEDANIVANYSDSGVVGRMRLIFNSAEKDVDEVFATGVVYSRSSYPELWEYAQLRAGLLIDEEDWQAKFMETNGKFVPYYSKGDGSTTFRTPLLGGYLKGAKTSGELGEYKEAGLPPINHTHTRGTMNITGSFTGRPHASAGNFGGALMTTTSGAFTHTIRGGTASHSGIAESETASTEDKVSFDASRSWTGETSNNSNVSQVYGNSDTVTPETMVGIWVIKAIGVIIDQGSTDLQDILNGVNDTQDRVSTLESEIVKVVSISKGGTNATTVADARKNLEIRFSLGGIGVNPQWATFAKAPKTNVTGNGGCTLILSGVSGFGGTRTGCWLVELSNRGQRASMTVRTLMEENNPEEIQFGYYDDGTNFCFGLYSPAYMADGSVTILRNNNFDIQDFGDATSEPSGWTPVTIIPVGLKEVYKSGTSWYRVWSDGWIEQGGRVTAGTSGTITFLKAFSDTNFTMTAQIGDATSTDTGGYDMCVGFSNITTTTVRYTCVANRYISWYACGY